MMDDRREDIEAAFDQAAAATPEPVAAPEAPETTPAAPSTPDTSAAAPETASEKAERARDTTGRFSKADKSAATSTVPKTVKPTPSAMDKTQAATASPQSTATPAPAAPAATTSTYKPPQAWKAGAREAWGSLPPAVQEEVSRREREIATSMQQTAQVRQFQQAFQETVSPFEGMIRAEGGDVMATVGSLLQTAAALRTAPAQHKAQLVAGICRQFGVDINLLDGELAGQPAHQQQGQGQGPSFDPGQLARQIEQQVMQRFAQQRGQQVQASAYSALEQFEATEPEFLPEVREDMAVLMESYARRGLTLEYGDAYAKACQNDPEISVILEQRKAAQRANAGGDASTQRALRASSSVKSQPATAVGGNAEQSRRGDIEAAYASLTGR